MTTRELQVIKADTGEQVGRIVMGDDGRVQADELGEAIYLQYQRRSDSDAQCFALLAGGWSNGYYRIPRVDLAG